MKISDETKNLIIVCLILLCMALICLYFAIKYELNYTEERLCYAKDYIELLENDNIDYVLDVASETDAYYNYYGYVVE